MDIAVVFCTLADLQSLFLCDCSAFSGFNQIFCKITETDAAVILNFTGAFIVQTTCIAAGTVTDGKFAVILVEPVGNVFDGDRFVDGIDGTLNRNDMHPDPVTSGRNQMRFALEGKKCHFVKTVCKLRILFNLPEDHVGHFRNPGNKHLYVPLLLVLRVFPVVFHNALLCRIGKQFHNTVFRFTGNLSDFSRRLGLSKSHLEHDLCDFITGACTVENDILRVILCQFFDAEFVRNPVRNHFAEIKQNFSCHRISPFLFLSVLRR